MTELEACLALRHCNGLGPRAWKRLLEHFGSAREAVSRYPHWEGLVSLAGYVSFAEESWCPGAEKEAELLRQVDADVLLFTDEGFPAWLRELSDPPLLLYAVGDLSLLQRPLVAIVGSRAASAYGVRMAESIARDLSLAGVCVVSGLAMGIDCAAHRGALSGPGSSVGVLGTGIDIVYPLRSQAEYDGLREKGLLLSEFLPGTRPEARNFPRRNRLVSGLSLGVLVAEGALKSGSLITARLALAQNREVFALPGPANSSGHRGCHQLLKEGACLVLNAQDILEELRVPLANFLTESPAPAEKSAIAEQRTFADPDQRLVYERVQALGPVHIDDLTRALEWSAEKTSTVLLLLELEGAVDQLPGMQYAVS